MRTAIRVKHVVSKSLNRFGIGIGVLQGNFNLGVFDRFIDIENIVIDDFFANIKVFNIALDTAFKVKAVAFASTLRLRGWYEYLWLDRRRGAGGQESCRN